MEKASVIIIGGGVVGLAVAAELSDSFDDIFVVEALPRPGMATSSRNSGVIHSGLYYPTGSHKARSCLEGNRLLFEFCERHQVPHRRTGKTVVANSPEDEARIEALLAQGRENGVEGLERLSRAALFRREPHIRALSGLWVPGTGLVDPEGLLQALGAKATRNGTHIATGARVEAVEPGPRAIRVKAGPAGDLEARALVNSAGLFADEVAALCGNDGYTIYPCRGEYWEVAPPLVGKVSGLIYPAPETAVHALGVHLTRTLAGTLLAGPNARYVESKTDYEADWEPRENFCRRVRQLLPEVEPADLKRAYSGIRPRLTAPGDARFADFAVERDAAHPNIIHLVGIESPGLTAALSLAREVAAMTRETLA